MNSIPSQRIYLLRHGAVQGFDRKTYYEICENTLSATIIVAHAGVNRVILAGMMDICLKDILKIPQDYAAGYVIEITPIEKKSACQQATAYAKQIGPLLYSARKFSWGSCQLT